MYVICHVSSLVYRTIFKMKQGSKMKVIKTVTTVEGTLYEGEIVKFQEAVNSNGDYRVKDAMGRIWFIKKENLE